jgi:hypothetical protein
MNASLQQATMNPPPSPVVGASPHIGEAILEALEAVYDYGHFDSFIGSMRGVGSHRVRSAGASLFAGGHRVRPAAAARTQWNPAIQHEDLCSQNFASGLPHSVHFGAL